MVVINAFWISINRKRLANPKHIFTITPMLFNLLQSLCYIYLYSITLKYKTIFFISSSSAWIHNETKRIVDFFLQTGWLACLFDLVVRLGEFLISRNYRGSRRLACVVFLILSECILKRPLKLKEITGLVNTIKRLWTWKTESVGWYDQRRGLSARRWSISIE